MKKIMTIMGEINPDELGITLPHEHLLWDARMYLENSSKPGETGRYEKEICLSNRGDVQFRPHFYEHDLTVFDIDQTIEEAMRYKRAGGKSIVDLTPIQMRDVQSIYEIAAATGIQIIFSSGNYISESWTDGERVRSGQDIKKQIVSEFRDGVGFLKHKPGIIGEVSVSGVSGKNDLDNLKGSAMAQKEIGCGMHIHPPFFNSDGSFATDGLIILDMLEEEGADISKICMDYCDITYEYEDYHDAMAKRGAFIEYDMFGSYAMTFSTLPGKYLISDLHRAKAIKAQVNRGNLKQILVSQDTSHKSHLMKWGGHGYGHILRNIVPMLRDYAGLTDEEIRMILIENPKRFLRF